MAKTRRNRSTQARQARAVVTETDAERELREFRTRQELKAEMEAQDMADEVTARAREDLERDDLNFDFSDLEWRDSQKISNALTAVAEAEREYDEEGNYVPAEVRDELREEAFASLRLWFSRVCSSVPLEWFSTSAQAEFKAEPPDFDDPETYERLQEIRVGRLINALSEARANSEKN